MKFRPVAQHLSTLAVFLPSKPKVAVYNQPAPTDDDDEEVNDDAYSYSFSVPADELRKKYANN